MSAVVAVNHQAVMELSESACMEVSAGVCRCQQESAGVCRCNNLRLSQAQKAVQSPEHCVQSAKTYPHASGCTCQEKLQRSRSSQHAHNALGDNPSIPRRNKVVHYRTVYHQKISFKWAETSSHTVMVFCMLLLLCMSLPACGLYTGARERVRDNSRSGGFGDRSRGSSRGNRYGSGSRDAIETYNDFMKNGDCSTGYFHIHMIIPPAQSIKKQFMRSLETLRDLIKKIDHDPNVCIAASYVSWDDKWGPQNVLDNICTNILQKNVSTVIFISTTGKLLQNLTILLSKWMHYHEIMGLKK